MMDFFYTLFQMSLQASLLICVVLVLRMFLRRLPKVYICMLWGLVLVRLLCPVFIESEFSLVPRMEDKAETAVTGQNSSFTTGDVQEASSVPDVEGDGTAIQTDVLESPAIDDKAVSANTAPGNVKGTEWSVTDILSLLWLVGIVGMAALYIFRYIRMKRMLSTAVRMENTVWECEEIQSPFVMGCISPRIYLPFGITGTEREYIISHERSHIRHFDPQLRIVEIAALCLHWWNPLVWLAVYRMNQDREMLCDEAVLRHADMNIRKEYSNTLLQFAMKQSKPAVIVSFGETNTEGRIKHILKFRRPTVIISVILILIIGICAVCFLTIPRTEADPVMDTGVNGTELTPTVSPEPSPTKAEEEPVDTSSLGDKEFAALVIQYLEEDNRAGFAALINYPIKVYIGDEQKLISNEEEFQEAYEQIITEELRAAVLATDTGNLFTNMYGVRMGNGELWFERFGSAGYQIYAINNSKEVSYPVEDPFATSWTDKTAGLDMSEQEKNTWYSKITGDIPNAEEAYEVRGISYEDMDRNGTRDLLVQLKLRDGIITPETYPGAYVCIYMNDDPVYIKEHDGGLYLGLRQVLSGDVDQDGYYEIIYSVDSGGNGGNGSEEKTILKYKGHTLINMNFPSDDSMADPVSYSDVGYEVKVLFGAGEGSYKAVCEALGQTVEFHAQNAVDDSGNKRVKTIREDEEAGDNCRGYTKFSIVERDGREYLMAKEYLAGEGGYSHCVGWATFLMDWDANATPTVLEFGVEELD